MIDTNPCSYWPQYQLEVNTGYVDSLYVFSYAIDSYYNSCTVTTLS